MRLYDLTGKWQELQSMSEEIEPVLLKDTLESIDILIDEKVENIAKIIKNNEATINAIKQEEQRFAERRRALENNNKRLKQLAQESLEAVGKDKVKGDLFTIGIQNNPTSVNVLDEKLIDSIYFVPQEPKLDKKMLLTDLKAGADIAGVEIQQTRSLRIR